MKLKSPVSPALQVDSLPTEPIYIYRLYGHEFEQTQGDSEGQQGLACCSSRSHNEWDTP